MQFVALLSLIFCACTSTFAQALKGNEFYVGAAAQKINPPVGSLLAGYHPNRKSTGINDDLYIKAVSISNHNNHICIVSIDCIGLPYPTVQRIREVIMTRQPGDGFNASQVVVSSTHTHAGPDLIGIWGETPEHSGVDSLYESVLVEAAAETAMKAWQKKELATAQWASTLFGAGWVENISIADELDKKLVALQFINRKNKNITTLVNFACHPTILDAGNTQCSADFPGATCKLLDQTLGGINIYLQGAIGGWVQPEKVPRNVEGMQQQGRLLAREVMTILKRPNALLQNTIRYQARMTEIPVSNPYFKRLSAANIIKRDIAEGTLTEVAWFGVGEARFATHPGESSPRYSIQTKELMHTSGPKFILGLGMDELGYILHPEFFKVNSKIHAVEYLKNMSPGPDAGPALMQVLQELAESEY